MGTNYIGIRDIQPKNQHDNTKENLSSLDFGAGDEEALQTTVISKKGSATNFWIYA